MTSVSDQTLLSDQLHDRLDGRQTSDRPAGGFREAGPEPSPRPSTSIAAVR